MRQLEEVYWVQIYIKNKLVQMFLQRTRLSVLEPLPPIYIQAPQPTIILRSDMHRLRAELNSTVRPQGTSNNLEFTCDNLFLD